MIRKNIWASSVKCYSSMGQSGFVGKKRNLPPLLSFSALLVCILPHCRLRDWCGNLRKANGHMVCRLDQSASFRIFDSTFYFPHSAIPHFTHSLIISLRGTAAAAPPPFRPGNPALCGSYPLVTPYCCRLGDLLCFVFIVSLVFFLLIV